MYMDIYRMKCSVESGMNSMHNTEGTSRQAQWYCHTWRAQLHTSKWHSMQIRLCTGTFVDCHHLVSCSPVQLGFQFVSSSLMAARREGIKEEHGHGLFQDISLTSWWASTFCTPQWPDRTTKAVVTNHVYEHLTEISELHVRRYTTRTQSEFILSIWVHTQIHSSVGTSTHTRTYTHYTYSTYVQHTNIGGFLHRAACI